MMNKQEMQAFRELFSKYCRQEINKGHCESEVFSQQGYFPCFEREAN